jgi:nucleoside-diphosphate-sugar epimerase
MARQICARRPHTCTQVSIAVLDRDHLADGPLNETEPMRYPGLAYGPHQASGRGGEVNVVGQSPQCAVIEYTILRLATVYGPGAKTDGRVDRCCSS